MGGLGLQNPNEVGCWANDIRAASYVCTVPLRLSIMECNETQVFSELGDPRDLSSWSTGLNVSFNNTHFFKSLL